jgi:hypothetical protein
MNAQRQWGVEIVGDPSAGGGGRKWVVERNEAGEGRARLGDDDFFAGGRAVDEGGEVALRFVEVDRANHRAYLLAKVGQYPNAASRG